MLLRLYNKNNNPKDLEEVIRILEVCTLCHITRLGIYSLISQVIHFLIEKNTIKPLKPVFRGLTMLCQTV